jgi:hypothetical protein
MVILIPLSAMGQQNRSIFQMPNNFCASRFLHEPKYFPSHDCRKYSISLPSQSVVISFPRITRGHYSQPPLKTNRRAKLKIQTYGIFFRQLHSEVVSHRVLITGRREALGKSSGETLRRRSETFFAHMMRERYQSRRLGEYDRKSIRLS